MNSEPWLREELTTGQRAADLDLTIDPGFVHHRRIQTLLGPGPMRFVDDAIERLPDLPEYLRRLRIDHIYTEAVVGFCSALNVPSLGAILASGRGRMFGSTIELEPVPDLYVIERANSRVVTPGVDNLRVELNYATKRIVADTTRMELRKGGPMAVVAQLRGLQGRCLTFDPLLMGGPWLKNPAGQDLMAAPEWYGNDFFEVFPEDIDEFAAVRNMDLPEDFSIMQSISEAAFKRCLGEILGDATGRDWGGETSDHFAAHLHLGGKPATGAFLLKGPARFAPMGLNHLGKNNDQIFRLAQEPAQLLIVQHCHEITSPVRATLQAFAVLPGRRRRYCLMDGRESLRLLMAHEKLDRAVALSTA